MSALRRNGLLCLLLAFLLCGIFLITAQEADAAIITDLRLAGQDRFETSFAIAEQLYRAKGSPFDNMTVASGMNY
ncbi:MAG: cell wall-binding repeat-containing protein, partial [Firmicutes bacterium]|nr:cell wall-binding repeat-containing protein [Bacillota bacterium]